MARPTSNPSQIQIDRDSTGALFYLLGLIHARGVWISQQFVKETYEELRKYGRELGTHVLWRILENRHAEFRLSESSLSKVLAAFPSLFEQVETAVFSAVHPIHEKVMESGSSALVIIPSSYAGENPEQTANAIVDRLTTLSTSTPPEIELYNGDLNILVHLQDSQSSSMDLDRLIGLHLDHAYASVPKVLFDSDTPISYKTNYVKGYADGAGNIRAANRYIDGRHRVRLDVFNWQTNWSFPVELCALLQTQLDIPVQSVNWGHPNLGRNFREHQINIFAKAFLPIGFTIEDKNRLLDELSTGDDRDNYTAGSNGCPGQKRLTRTKATSDLESSEKLAPQIRGKHFDSYWQICQGLGCQRAKQT